LVWACFSACPSSLTSLIEAGVRDDLVVGAVDALAVVADLLVAERLCLKLVDARLTLSDNDARGFVAVAVAVGGLSEPVGDTANARAVGGAADLDAAEVDNDFETG
jgi:hypothetical protein